MPPFCDPPWKEGVARRSEVLAADLGVSGSGAGYVAVDVQQMAGKYVHSS